MDLNGKNGGGGGPKQKFSFKTAAATSSGFNVAAAEFVPSWGVAAAQQSQPQQYQQTQPQQYQQTQPQYQQPQQYQQQYQYNQNGYYGGANQQQQYYATNQYQQFTPPQKPATSSIPYFEPKSTTTSSKADGSNTSLNKEAKNPKPASPKPSAKPQPKPEKKQPAKAKPATVSTPAPSSAPIIVDEPEENFDMTNVKENVNILFMGHVDAGKSTMGGHIL